jgi:hypothetical protein
MRFETKKDKSLLYIFGFAFFIYFGVTVFSILLEDDYKIIWPFSVVLILLGLLLIAISKTTYFVLTKDKLICKSLFLKKEILFNSIRSIERYKGFIFTDQKMSTSRKGLIIHYNKYDEIFISPQNEDTFILELENRKTCLIKLEKTIR